ncbi:ATP-binding protein [Nautilia sp.]
MKKDIFLIILLAFLYYVTGELSFKLFFGIKIINIGLFIPEGIALAFALYFGKKVLPGIFLGQFLLAFNNGIDLAPSVFIGIINTLEAYMGITLFKKFNLSVKLSAFRDITGLFILIFFVLQPFSAVVSNTVLSFYYKTGLNEFLIKVFSWWFGNIMGQMLFTPFLLLLFEKIKRIKWTSFFLLGAVFAFYLYIIEICLKIHNPFVLITLSLSVVVYVTIKKDLFYGIYLSVVSSMVSAYSVYLNTGAFFLGSALENTVNYNLYVFVHIVIVIMFGVLFEERRYYEEYLEKRIEEEVKKNESHQVLMLHQNRLAQLGELINMIAHQWRQPLNNLAILNQLLVKKYKNGEIDKKTFEYFEKHSKKQIDYMSDTIDSFRNFFQKDEGKAEYFSLKKCLYRVLYLLNPVLKDRNIEICVNIPDENLYGYPRSFSQALLNILNNAKDVLIQRNVNDKKIYITSEKKGEYIIINIEDNGGGIDKSVIDEVFTPYFSTKVSKNGTGMGLYIAKIIIEKKMGGELSVYNTKNGANFTIRLKA